MEFTGERYIPGQGGAIELEHLNRYYFVVYQIDLTGKTVLDIASGEGYGSNILAKHAGKVIGVDISYEAIEHAKIKYQAKNLKFIEGSVIEIPLEDKSVDVIVCFETIEHHDKHTEMMFEFKRVLKNEGLLFISSPEKYYYSEIPKYENIFHIKELYYNDFKDIIKTHFQRTFLFFQNIFVGSMIIIDEDSQEYQKPMVINCEGRSQEFNPLYNIAICTNNECYTPNIPIVLYKESDEFLSQKDVQLAFQSGMQTVKNRLAYRVGHIIVKPILFMRDIFK